MHDQLLAEMPEGVEHSCVMCDGHSSPAPNRQTAKESDVGEPRTFTQQEHEAILTSAVEREVAEATKEKQDEISDLQSKIDVLEAEKAAAVKEAEDAKQEFEDFKTEMENEQAARERADQRVQTIKEVAGDLGEEFFTDERIKRWSEMAEEQFTDLVDGLAEAAIGRLSPEEAELLEGLEGDERRSKLIELNAARTTREAANEAAENGGMRETAAFGGGQSPTSKKGAGNGPSTLSQLFRLPTRA